jgi:hypothetical protein
VVEYENLIAQHGETIDILLAFVMFNAGDGSLEAGYVGLECNRKALAKTTLGAIADDTQDPGSSSGNCQSDRSNDHLTVFFRKNAVCQETQPQREQGIGERGKER